MVVERASAHPLPKPWGVPDLRPWSDAHHDGGAIGEINRLPVRVIEFAPQYRGFEYILVGDEIVIVDPRTHRIVAVIPA